MSVSACIEVHLCVKSDILRDLKIQIRIQFYFENAGSDPYFIDDYGSTVYCKLKELTFVLVFIPMIVYIYIYAKQKSSFVEF
jgi:hypothetical protein